MRSRGLHARSLGVLDQRGIADRFVAQGQRYPVTTRSASRSRRDRASALPKGVERIDAEQTGPCDLPAIGPVPPPTTVLVRPDGYVAWVGEGTLDGLEEALTRWC